MVNKLNVLLIEDNDAECEAIKEYSKTTNDVKLIAVTNSARKGIEYVEQLLPDVVILDLELHAGDGNGISFLNTLNHLDISCYPYVLVTTNNINSITHAKVRDCGAGHIMTKNQDNYSAGYVIEFLRDMKDYIKISAHINKSISNLSTIETPEEFSKRISRLINKEFDLVCLSPKMKGRNYLKEGIQILIQNENEAGICALIAQKHKKTDASVERAMQHVLNHAWRTIPIEDLKKYYTAYINPQKGIPTKTEFMYYYAEKIRNNI